MMPSAVTAVAILALLATLVASIDDEHLPQAKVSATPPPRVAFLRALQSNGVSYAVYDSQEVLSAGTRDTLDGGRPGLQPQGESLAAAAPKQAAGRRTEAAKREPAARHNAAATEPLEKEAAAKGKAAGEQRRTAPTPVAFDSPQRVAINAPSFRIRGANLPGSCPGDNQVKFRVGWSDPYEVRQLMAIDVRRGQRAWGGQTTGAHRCSDGRVCWAACR